MIVQGRNGSAAPWTIVSEWFSRQLCPLYEFIRGNRQVATSLAGPL